MKPYALMRKPKGLGLTKTQAAELDKLFLEATDRAMYER